MADGYLIDTNAFIDYFGARLPESGMLFMDNLIDSGPAMSVITEIELLTHIQKTADEQIFPAATSYIFSLTRDVVSRTIQIRRSRPKTKVPDAIIAATALVHNLILVTRNERDFIGIEGLHLVNPHEP